MAELQYGHFAALPFQHIPLAIYLISLCGDHDIVSIYSIFFISGGY